jgi:hypothetical protein
MVFSMVFVFAAPSALWAYPIPKEPWPCPEFGECRFHFVLGPCRLVTTFEYSRRLHTKGNAAFWEQDEPRPCLMTSRVGKKLSRHTYNKQNCDEILRLFYRAARNAGFSQRAENSELFQCDASRHGGRLTLVHPETEFFDGHWHSLTREAHTILGAQDCLVNHEKKQVRCQALAGEAWDWVNDLLLKTGWQLLSEQNTLDLPGAAADSNTLRLAPGDRMKENY